MSFTIGIDYGTNSVRAIVVDCSDGREIGSAVVNYPTGSSGQTCALGSAISAAVLAGPKVGGYADFQSAQKSMTSLNPVKYEPIPENEALYNRLYALYRQMHDAFGGVNRSADLSGVMKELIRIREEQTHA